MIPYQQRITGQEFDGAGDRVVAAEGGLGPIADFGGAGDEFTICLWGYSEAANGDLMNWNANYGYISVVSSCLQLVVQRIGSPIPFISFSPVTCLDTPFHVALKVPDGEGALASALLYLQDTDTEYAASDCAFTESGLTMGPELGIGARITGTNPFTGWIGGVQIFDEVLSDADIRLVRGASAPVGDSRLVYNSLITADGQSVPDGAGSYHGRKGATEESDTDDPVDKPLKLSGGGVVEL